MVRYRVQKALYTSGKMFTQKMTHTSNMGCLNQAMQTLLKDITTNVLQSIIDTPINQLKNFDYDPITNEYIPKTSTIIRQCKVLQSYVYKNFDVLMKSKAIVADLENYKAQLEAVQQLKEKYQQQTNQAGAQDIVLPISMGHNVKVDLSTQYLLYQHLFGYPQDGIWDTEKLQIIADALANANVDG